MADNQNQLYFNEGGKYQVELSFDECKSGKRDNGQSWYRYAVKYEGSDAYFFANDFSLHNKLKEFSRGAVLLIEPLFKSGEKYPSDWNVSAMSSNNTKNKKNEPSDTEIKIAVFASMKIAGTISTNLDELRDNTYNVLALHSEVCEAVKKEKEVEKLKEDLF